VVGDRVVVERSDAGPSEAWTIEQVHDRQSELARKAPGKAPRAKVIVANVDQVVVVFAAARPEPHLRMLDRFLVLCEANGLDALIVANKVDLVGPEAARERFGIYERIGYPVLYTSPKQDVGLDELQGRICGKMSALTGPSGVGKSSLLNAVQPGLALRVASVSDAVQKGRHTTVTAQLVPLECGGYVADTPGLRELGRWRNWTGIFPRCGRFWAPAATATPARTPTSPVVRCVPRRRRGRSRPPGTIVTSA
jgi:ribosome biogenesis GTPase